MKRFYLQVAKILFGLLLLIAILSNLIMFVITNELVSAPNLFDKLDVVQKYHLFDYEWFALATLMLSIAILTSIFIFYVRLSRLKVKDL